MNVVIRLWNAMSKTERWAWLCIIVVAVLLTIAFRDLEGVAVILGAVSWRLIWIGLRMVLRVARRGP
jgi:hypothetical protein